MAKRKPKPKFLPDLTAPSHEDLKIQALKKEQSGKGIKATKTKGGKTSDRITSDTPPVIDVTEFALSGICHPQAAVMQQL